MADTEYTPDSTAHSSVVGGSTANRRIMCPRSLQLESQLPIETKDEESSYAAEGTALHNAIAYILDNNVTLENLNDLVGMTFYDHTLTVEQVSEALVPAVEFIDRLSAAADTEGGLEFEIEKRCEFPGIPGSFGTSDFVGRTDKRTIIIDWKFGAGKPVYAWKEVEDDGMFPFARRLKLPFSEQPLLVVGNPQLMYYGRAAMKTLPDLFGENPDWPVELYIVQPRISDAMGAKSSRHSTTVGELLAFEKLLIERVDLAREATAPLATVKGDYCNWCRCQPICPLWTGPVLDLTKALEAAGTSKLDLKRTTKMPVEEYAELISYYLDLFDNIEELQTEAQTAAFNLLEQGIEVPNWCLKPKRAGHDKWKDDDKAEAYLGRQGVDLHVRRITKVMTPAAARAELKKMGKVLKEDYVQPGVSSGLTLGRLDKTTNPVKVLPASAIAEKLAGLVGQQ